MLRRARLSAAAACMLALVAAASAQDNAPETLVLRGVVGSAEASAVPLPRARVSVEGADGQHRFVFTDERGRFEIPMTAATQQTVTIFKSGYARHQLPVRVEPDRPTEVRLSPAAVLIGTVVNEVGAPVADAGVLLRPLRGRAGAPLWTSPVAAATDDRGEFRIGTLPAGRFSVSVTPAALAIMRGMSGDVMLRYTGTGATESQVELRAGKESVVSLVQERPDGGAARQASSPTPRDRGAILGRVIDSSGRPAAAARVRVTSASGVLRIGVCDADGRYEVRDVPPGSIRVAATADGFIETVYGANGSPGTIAVRPGEKVAGIDLTLMRGSVIAGTVTDESGEPLEGLTVHIWQSRWVDGRAVVSPVNGVTKRITNDRGQYRLHSVLPGSYYVSVTDPRPQGLGSGHWGSDGLLVRPVWPTGPGRQVFFPGRATVREANVVHVGSGQDAFGIDVPFVPGPRARVHGRVEADSGPPFDLAVVLSVSQRSGAPLLEPSRMPSGGAFEFDGLPPGEYVLQAYGSSGPADVFGTTFVTVTEGDRDVGPITLRLARGSIMRGRVRAEGGTLHSATLRAVPADPDYALSPPFFDIESPVSEEGAFAIANLTGPMRFVLDAPEGWFLKSVMIDGVNAADDPVTFSTATGSRSDVEVVVSSRGAEVSGRVSSSSRRDLSGLVVVFPTDDARWYYGSRYVKSTRANQGGRFNVSGLPPGEYWVAIATLDEEVNVGEWQAPEALSTLLPSARRLKLSEGTTATVELPVHGR